MAALLRRVEIRADLDALTDDADEPDWQALASAATAWDHLDHAERRELLAETLARVSLHRTYAVLEYHHPLTPDGRTTARVRLTPLIRRRIMKPTCSASTEPKNGHSRTAKA